jgi:hypothetical protein
MNRVAVWVAHTTVGATVPTALAQATATPLPEIEAGARLDPDIAAQPLVALNVILGREGHGAGRLDSTRQDPTRRCAHRASCNRGE